MRLEQDSQKQLKKVGRRSQIFSQSETTLKVLLDTDVEKLQKLISGTKVYSPETNSSLTRVCESLLVNHAAYSKAVRSNSASLSSFSNNNRGNNDSRDY